MPQYVVLPARLADTRAIRFRFPSRKSMPLLLASAHSSRTGTFARDGEFPDPLPNRSSRLDGVDLKNLIKLWEEDERVFGGRSHEELQFFTDNGSWPEQRGRLLYSIQGGKLFVEWQNDLEQESVSPRTTAQEQGT